MELAHRGDAAGGVETIRARLRELHDAGYELLTTTFNIVLVHGLLALGQIERSARLIDDAIRLVEQGGDHLYMPELLRMKGNVLLSLSEPSANLERRLQQPLGFLAPAGSARLARSIAARSSQAFAPVRRLSSSDCTGGFPLPRVRLRPGQQDLALHAQQLGHVEMIAALLDETDRIVDQAARSARSVRAPDKP